MQGLVPKKRLKDVDRLADAMGILVPKTIRKNGPYRMGEHPNSRKNLNRKGLPQNFKQQLATTLNWGKRCVAGSAKSWFVRQQIIRLMYAKEYKELSPHKRQVIDKILLQANVIDKAIANLLVTFDELKAEPGDTPPKCPGRHPAGRTAD